MSNYEKWSYIENDFIQKDSLRVEEEEGALKMYHYFSTLRWKWCYAIVYNDIMLREHEECDASSLYDEWDMAVDMFNLLKEEDKCEHTLKIGDTVFVITNVCHSEEATDCPKKECDNCPFNYMYISQAIIYSTIELEKMQKELNSSVFLTLDAAENAMKAKGKIVSYDKS